MNVIILAAGYGTRLYPLTVDKPKSLLAVNNKPIINFLVDKVDKLKESVSISGLRVVSNNRFYNNFLEWKDKYNIDVELLNDGSNTPEDRCGAIQDIYFATKDLKGDCLILGGDNFFEDDLFELVDFSFKNKPNVCVGLCDIKNISEAERFGVVKLDSQYRITELKEKPKNPESTLVATCIYFMPEASLNFLDKYLSSQSHKDASGKYIEWLSQNSKVYGYVFKGEWLDIGHKEALKNAQELDSGV